MEATTLFLVAVAASLFYYLRRTDPLSALPGPFRLPIIGNLQFQFSRLHLQFTEFAEKYGDLYRINILSQPAIVINSYSILKEAYVKRGKDFSNRPNMHRFNVIGASQGMAFRVQADEELQRQRVKASRALSLNKSNLPHLEGLINENLTELVKLFKQTNGEAFNPKLLIKQFLINIILTMIFGEKVDYDDPILQKIIDFNEAAVEAATIGKEDVDVWTWTKSFNPNHKLSTIARQLFEQNIIPLYNRYKETHIDGHERGVIDSYIADVKSGSNDDSTVHGVLIDFFVGGVETTATTLYGFMLILLHNPKIQQRLQSDLDEYIGRDRFATMADKKSLPYYEACVLELLRYQSTLPILIPRATECDTMLAGYHIPKGTWVYANAWAIHHNEEVYPDAMTYNPDRFLDEEGNLLPCDHQVRKHIVQFGLGARHCIGEQLAKNRIFLSLCALMQQFTFEPEGTAPAADARLYKLKIVFDISDYTLRAVPRV